MKNKIPFTVILVHIHTDFLKTIKPFRNDAVQTRSSIGWQSNARQVLLYKTQDGAFESLSCQQA